MRDFRLSPLILALASLGVSAQTGDSSAPLDAPPSFSESSVDVLQSPSENRVELLSSGSAPVSTHSSYIYTPEQKETIVASEELSVSDEEVSEEPEVLFVPVCPPFLPNGDRLSVEAAARVERYASSCEWGEAFVAEASPLLLSVSEQTLCPASGSLARKHLEADAEPVFRFRDELARWRKANVVDAASYTPSAHVPFVGSTPFRNFAKKRTPSETRSPEPIIETQRRLFVGGEEPRVAALRRAEKCSAEKNDESRVAALSPSLVVHRIVNMDGCTYVLSLLRAQASVVAGSSAWVALPFGRTSCSAPSASEVAEAFYSVEANARLSSSVAKMFPSKTLPFASHVRFVSVPDLPIEPPPAPKKNRKK